MKYSEWITQQTAANPNVCQSYAAGTSRRYAQYNSMQGYYQGEDNPVYFLAAFTQLEPERGREVLAAYMATINTEGVNEDVAVNLATASNQNATSQQLEDALTATTALLDTELGQDLVLCQAVKTTLKVRTQGWATNSMVSILTMLMSYKGMKEGGAAVKESMMTFFRSQISEEEFIYVDSDPGQPRFDNVLEPE